MPCGAGAVDHFAAYVALVGTVLTLFGTFGALLITRHFERKREVARRAREDQTKFHDMRIEAYAEYLSVTAVMFGAADVWFQRSITVGALRPVEGELADTYPKYLNAFSRLSLVASGAVLEKAAVVHEQINTLVGPLGADSPETAAKVLDDLAKARQKFFGEARAELGIAEIEVPEPAKLRAYKKS